MGTADGVARAPRERRARARREIREEAGYDVAFRRVLDVSSDPDARRLDVWLEYELVGGQFRPSAEAADEAWVKSNVPPGVPHSQRAFLEAYWGGRRARSLD